MLTLLPEPDDDDEQAPTETGADRRPADLAEGARASVQATSVVRWRQARKNGWKKIAGECAPDWLTRAGPANMAARPGCPASLRSAEERKRAEPRLCSGRRHRTVGPASAQPCVACTSLPT